MERPSFSVNRWRWIVVSRSALSALSALSAAALSVAVVVDAIVSIAVPTNRNRRNPDFFDTSGIPGPDSRLCATGTRARARARTRTRCGSTGWREPTNPAPSAWRWCRRPSTLPFSRCRSCRWWWRGPCTFAARASGATATATWPCRCRRRRLRKSEQAMRHRMPEAEWDPFAATWACHRNYNRNRNAEPTIRHRMHPRIILHHHHHRTHHQQPEADWDPLARSWKKRAPSWKASRSRPTTWPSRLVTTEPTMPSMHHPTNRLRPKRHHHHHHHHKHGPPPPPPADWDPLP
mmetsp:Transcript_24374/g.53362  ORF Transcript_24374/g.53362 Transcript_24374/m.53362 type:complete len:291 (+) Transcript_24374:944-1816(+)